MVDVEHFVMRAVNISTAAAGGGAPERAPQTAADPRSPGRTAAGRRRSAGDRQSSTGTSAATEDQQRSGTNT